MILVVYDLVDDYFGRLRPNFSSKRTFFDWIRPRAMFFSLCGTLATFLLGYNLGRCFLLGCDLGRHFLLGYNLGQRFLGKKRTTEVGFGFQNV